jgi:hypothetical protein
MITTPVSGKTIGPDVEFEEAAIFIQALLEGKRK